MVDLCISTYITISNDTCIIYNNFTYIMIFRFGGICMKFHNIERSLFWYVGWDMELLIDECWYVWMIISYIAEDEYLNCIVDVNLFLLLLYIVYINKELFGKKSSASFYFYVLKIFYLCSTFEKGTTRW